MRIVADENIPFAQEAFGRLGEVLTVPGRVISSTHLLDATVLLVRSVTAVDANLLEGTPVRFVGTATIGTDHLDTSFLQQAGIRYAAAPGSNADSVADWFVTALLVAAEKLGLTLAGRTIGVIGCGNVGRRVADRARGLGMIVLENDPPLAETTRDPRYRPLDDLLDADVITMHTPLARSGPCPTWHLVDGPFLARMRRGSLLINAGRGGCVDGTALKAALRSGHLSGAVLDVWENEPNIDPELVRLLLLGTPHIAGYSYDGKTRGVSMIYSQVCDWMGTPAAWDPYAELPQPDTPTIEVEGACRTDEDALREVVSVAYPVRRDAELLLQAATNRSAMGGNDVAEAFDSIRRNYPVRREFSLTRVRIRNGTDTLAAKLRGVGFNAVLL